MDNQLRDHTDKGCRVKLSIFIGECDNLYSKKTYLKYFLRHLMSMNIGGYLVRNLSFEK